MSKKVTHLVDKIYKNGQVMATLENNILTVYYENGVVKAQGKVQNEQMQGKWLFYSKKNNLIQIGNFKSDIKHGEFIRYDTEGKINYHVIFNEGKEVERKI